VILGIGNDEKTIDKHGQRFIERIYTDVEKRKSEKRAQRVPSYAKRFAAKEACSKALGTGLSNGVFWRDMGVVNLPSGKPTMHLTNGAAAQLARMVPDGKTAVVHLTMTDEYPYAQAVVIIEAV
jgi:holo-[acyl-carrier protein] synthase